jgi:hypothetical protein
MQFIKSDFLLGALPMGAGTRQHRRTTCSGTRLDVFRHLRRPVVLRHHTLPHPPTIELICDVARRLFGSGAGRRLSFLDEDDPDEIWIGMPHKPRRSRWPKRLENPTIQRI